MHKSTFFILFLFTWTFALSETIDYYITNRKYRIAYDLIKSEVDSLRSEGQITESRAELLIAGSYCAAQLGIWDTSYNFSKEVLPIADSLENHSLKGIAQMNMGVSLKSWGRFDDAVNIYKKALISLQKAEDTLNMICLYSNMGIVYKEWARYDEARSWYLKVLSKKEQMADTAGIITVLNNLAGVHFQTGDTTRARELLDRATTYARAIKHQYFEAYLIENSATSMLEHNNFEKALKMYRQAMVLYRKTGNKEGIAGSYSNVASVFSKKGDYKNALIYHDSALVDYKKLKQKPRIGGALTSTGITLWRAGLYKSSVDTLKKAVSIFEELRTTAAGDIRRDYLSSQIEVYQWLISSLIRAEDTTSAADIAEQASARYLAEAVSGSESVQYKGLDKYRKSIPGSTLYIRFANTGAEAPFTIFAYDKKRIRAVEPNVDSLTAALQPALPLMDKISTTVALRGIRIVGTKPDDSADFEGLVTVYRNLLLRPHLTGSQAVTLRKLSAALYEFLIGNFGDMIKGKEELVIIPDGFLATLPFETLLTPSGKYMIEEHTIRYLPSNTISSLITPRKSDSRRRMLCAFGGAVYNDSALSSFPDFSENQISAVRSDVIGKINEGVNLTGAFERIGLNAWTNLPGTFGEVKALKGIFKGAKVITGNKVSEKVIRNASEKGLLSKYKYLHFAVHGFVVPEIPELSALVLSNAGTNIGGTDGYLMAHEVAKLNLNADVVTLSACETALGKIYPGEGVVGLAQSFLIAGTRGVTSSLWQVSDESTKEFMTETYSRMKNENISFAEALASVKRSFIRGEIMPESDDAAHEKTYKHPFFWAPFIYFGN